QEKLMKKLMHDPDFQKQMLELLQDPEVSDQMLDVMKSQKFRSHLDETIQQTIETPLFQAKMKNILSKVEEKQENKQEDEGEGQSQDEGSGGDKKEKGSENE